MLFRMIPFALMLLFLNGCVTKIDIDYKATESSTPVAGASAVVIDLDDGRDVLTGWKSSGNFATAVKTNKPVNEALSEALHTELRNRGFSFGKGPGAVTMAARVTTMRFHYRKQGGLINSSAAVAIALKVFGPDKAPYYEEEFSANDRIDNEFYWFITPTPGDAIPRLFNEVVHQAMADEKLFAAILKAHADAAAQSANPPVMPDQARQTAGIGS